MKQKEFFLAVFVLLSARISYGQQKCISGSASATNLIDQLAEAKRSSPITRLIASEFNLQSKIEACTSDFCIPKTGSIPAYAQIESIQQIIQQPVASKEDSGSALLMFKPECMAAANTFKAATAEISCPAGNKASESSCINAEQLAYQNAVITSFANCTMKENMLGVDAAALFSMFSKESGFRPNYSYVGGVGIGQLTSIFVEDIHQKHRGYGLMKQVANSNTPDCRAAQLIAKKDLNNKPSLSDRCSFIGTGEGMERNIFYTLIGMANSWQKDIKPVLKDYLEKYKNDPMIDEVKDLAVLNAYGPGGRAAARAAVSRLSVLKPEQFIKAMKKPLYRREGRSLTIYTTNLANRQNSIAKLLPSSMQETGAKACINNPF